MYRKSVDYGQQSAIQVAEFASFRRRAEQAPQLFIDSPQGLQFRIRKMSNTVLLVMVIADLLVQPRGRHKRAVSRVFQDFLIDNVPKNHHVYQHENTLEQLLNCIMQRSRDLASVQDLIVNYSITEFVLNCYGRKAIKNYLDAHRANPCQLNLYGNEEEILVDYNAEIRGELLQMLAWALKISACVAYKDAGGQLDDTFKQFYGDRNCPNKVELWDAGEYYRVTISLGEEETKLVSINSSHNIMYIDSKNKKEPESLNTTMEGQSVRLDSRSANKDIRCLKCNAKGACQCDRSTRKAAISRQLTTNLPNRSIFDSIGLGTGPKRQTSTHEISATKR